MSFNMLATVVVLLVIYKDCYVKNLHCQLLGVNLASTFYVRFAGIVSSSQKNQHVQFVKLLRISGFVLSVALLAVGGNYILPPIML